MKEFLKFKNYNSFIDYVKSLSRDLKSEKGFEIHHIQPKSLGGSNLPENLIKLTVQEHVYAHYLLALEGDPKMLFAFKIITDSQFTSLKDVERLEILELENFSKLRESALETTRERMIKDNPMFQKEIKEKAVEAQKEILRKHPEKKLESSLRSLEFYNQHPEISEKLRQKNIKYYQEHPEKIEEFKNRIFKFFQENEGLRSFYTYQAWSRPEYREKHTGNQHPMKKEENRKKAAINTKKLWENPKYKESQIAKIKQGWSEQRREEQSKRTSHFYESHPEELQKKSQKSKEMWSTPGFKEKMKEVRKDLKWFNNGEINVKRKECPEGFKPGRVSSNLHWYTDGIQSIQARECPEGFKPGRA